MLHANMVLLALSTCWCRKCCRMNLQCWVPGVSAQKGTHTHLESFHEEGGINLINCPLADTWLTPHNKHAYKNWHGS